MRLTLGTRSVDLATRALVIGPPGGGGPGDDQPDLVELVMGDPSLRRAADRPAAAWIDGSDEAAAAAFGAAAVLVGTTSPGDPIDGLLSGCARAGATVVVGAPGEALEDVRARLVERARRAEAAGIPPGRIVLEAHLTPTLLPHLRRFAELGYPVLVTVTTPVVRCLEADHAAVAALAVIEGARLLRTDAVRAVARACRVVSAILEAR